MPGISDSLAEISRRVARADELLALQRARMCRCRGTGLDAGKVLLKVMQEIAEQFRTSHKILQSCVLRDRNGPETWNGGPAACGHAPVGVAETLLERREQRVPCAQPAGFLCPDCGVTIGVKGEGDGTYVYDLADWEQRCRHSDLRSPVLCQLLGRGHSTVLH